MPDLIDDRLHHLAGILNQVDEGKQDLTIGLAELLDDGGRLLRGAGHHMIRFLHGGRLLSVFLRLATGFYRTGTHRRLPTFNYDRDALSSRYHRRWTGRRAYCANQGYRLRTN